MKISFLKILIFVLSTVGLYAQVDNRILAKIGSVEISVDEFRNRYEFMPHLNFSNNNPDTLRIEFLYSLIAEKLWALASIEYGVDTFETLKYSLRTLEKLFVKDELFKKEVESKIHLTSEEISKGLNKATRILFINFITSVDSVEINNIYSSLKEGADFDSILKTRKEYQIQQKPHEIELGRFEDEKIEDAVFSLNLNEFTHPLKSKDQWFIFKLKDDRVNQTIRTDSDHARNFVLKTLSERKRKKIAGNFLDEVIGGKVISADKKIFNKLSESLHKILKEKVGSIEQESKQKIPLTETDIMKLLKVFDKSDLDYSFINLDKNPATLKEFLYYLIYQPRRDAFAKNDFTSANKNHVRSILNSAIKQFIEDEVIVRKGYEMGIDKFPSVKNDLEIWKNYYLSETLMQRYADSVKVSDNDMREFLQKKYDRNGLVPQVNIVEILTDNLDEIKIILDELQQGKDFNDLAVKFNKREITKRSNGEWGFFSVNSAGEIGRIAAQMNIGEVYGPIKVPEGFSIFKLIDKREIELSNTDTLLINPQMIRIQLALSKMNELINDKTVELANKYKIEFNETLLRLIELSEVNTFTYRLIGFGGKISAFPLTIPMFEWYQKYKQIKKLP